MSLFSENCKCAGCLALDELELDQRPKHLAHVLAQLIIDDTNTTIGVNVQMGAITDQEALDTIVALKAFLNASLGASIEKGRMEESNV
jgi:hypothetical protein